MTFPVPPPDAFLVRRPRSGVAAAALQTLLTRCVSPGRPASPRSREGRLRLAFLAASELPDSAGETKGRSRELPAITLKPRGRAQQLVPVTCSLSLRALPCLSAA